MMLKDKVAVIYGAAGGIGGAVARAFAREGATVFLTGRTLAPVEVVAKDIGGNFVAGMNVILQGRLVTAGEMATRFAQPLQDAASELGSLLLP